MFPKSGRSFRNHGPSLGRIWPDLGRRRIEIERMTPSSGRRPNLAPKRPSFGVAFSRVGARWATSARNRPNFTKVGPRRARPGFDHMLVEAGQVETCSADIGQHWPGSGQKSRSRTDLRQHLLTSPGWPRIGERVAKLQRLPHLARCMASHRLGSHRRLEQQLHEAQRRTASAGCRRPQRAGRGAEEAPSGAIRAYAESKQCRPKPANFCRGPARFGQAWADSHRGWTANLGQIRPGADQTRSDFGGFGAGFDQNWPEFGPVWTTRAWGTSSTLGQVLRNVAH